MDKKSKETSNNDAVTDKINQVEINIDSDIDTVNTVNTVNIDKIDMDHIIVDHIGDNIDINNIGADADDNDNNIDTDNIDNNTNNNINIKKIDINEININKINNGTIEKPIENTNSDEPKYKNLVMSGGSVKGISLIGAIMRLVKEKLIDLKKLKAVAGTSAGSMLALLIALGFSIDEIWNFMYCLDLKKLVEPNVLLFLEKCGVETGQIIHNLFEEILTKKTGLKHINFKQLHELTNIHLTIVGSCLTTKEVVYYDHINTPTFKVSTAIRISISMPGFFIPVVVDNKKYVDGSIFNNYPMNLFEDRLDETIGLLICGEYDTNYKYPEQYLMAIMNLFMYQYFKMTADQYPDNTIFITQSPKNVNILNFDVNNKTKIKLRDCGIAATEEFIKKLSDKVNAKQKN